MFNGPNIVLKLHVDRVYTSQDIAIFCIWPVWLEISCLFTPLLGEFLEDITPN